MSRQAATPAATLSAVMLKNIDNQTIDGEEKSKRSAELMAKSRNELIFRSATSIRQSASLSL